MQRIQHDLIIKDLSKKMVFLTGPRQVGKTYLARMIANRFHHPLYLNYDQIHDRKVIQDQSWLRNTDLLILDELHKMPDWKNYLKGVYDTKPAEQAILVTGSTKLGVFEHMGDSLAGRYFSHRLLPLSAAELYQLGIKYSLDDLLAKGGFPEPYLLDDPVDGKRWRLQYINSLLSTDALDFDNIQNIRALRLIFELLRNRVGSPVSYQALSEDAAVSPATVRKYIEILEALYVVFRITPFSKNIARSLLKEPKIYFFDTGLIEDNGAKLENLVALSLLKHIYAQIDYSAENYSLNYLKTKEGQEVDFVLAHNNNIEQMIEVKYSDPNPTKSLKLFHERYGFPAIQLVQQLRNDHMSGSIKILRAEKFLSSLTL